MGIVGAAYAWWHLDRGWFPSNAGAFALSAERVLDGLLAHKDFNEIYTGGDNYLHALAFKLFGKNLGVLRYPLFLVFLTWIPSAYYVASRFARPVTAGCITLLSIIWSLPLYSEPIATWYNIFFGTHGIAALLRFFETRRRLWLYVVGACVGLSILAKIIGVYTLAAVSLALLHDEQLRGRSVHVLVAGGARLRAAAYGALLATLAFGCAAAACWLAGRFHGTAGILQFGVPIAAVSAVIVRNELAPSGRAPPFRLREHARLVLPVVLGVVLVVAPFLVPYVLTGSVGDLARGVFLEPQRRLDVTSVVPPMLSWVAIPMVAFFAWVPRWPRIPAAILGTAFAAAGAALLVLGATPPVDVLSGSLRALLPATVLAGSILLITRLVDDARAPFVFAVMAAAGWFGLVQFPVATTIYIAFTLPFGALSMLAVFDCKHHSAGAAVVGLVALWIAVSVPIIEEGRGLYVERMDIDRGAGIRITAEDRILYESVVRLVRAHAVGNYIYATPDCPEVYFLSGFRNPTRSTYEFFDEPDGYVERVRTAIASADVRVVVLNHEPEFSSFPPDELVAYVRRTYPEKATVGRFEVRWKP